MVWLILLQSCLVFGQQDMQQQLQHSQAEETILKCLGFGFQSTSPSSDGARGIRKRHSEDGGDPVPAKKIPAVLDSIPPPPQPGVQSRSNLQEKNKMLAQLLAKEPATPTMIPNLPPSIIYATPQERLPKISVSSTRPTAGKRANPSLCLSTSRVSAILRNQCDYVLFFLQ